MASSLTNSQLSTDTIFTNSYYYKIFSPDEIFSTDKYTFTSDTGSEPLHGGFMVYHVPTALSYYTSSKSWVRQKGSGGPGTIYTLAYKSSDYEYIVAPENGAIFYYALFKGEQPSQYAPNNFTKHGWYLYSPYMMGGGANYNNITGDGEQCFDGSDGGTSPTEEGIRVGSYKFFGDSFPYGMFCFVYILGKIDTPN